MFLAVAGVMVPVFNWIATGLDPLGWKELGGWLLALVVLAGMIWLAMRWQSRRSLPGFFKLGRFSLFDPIRNARRARLLRDPFPEQWQSILQNVAVYHILSPTEQARLRDDLRILIAEKRWEGCAGLEMTDQIKVTVAALASVLLLGMDHNYFDTVPSILVYPSGFMVPHELMGTEGVCRDVAVLGQAWYRGPVVLAWDRVIKEARTLHTRSNVVYHEFAHQLDFTGEAGDADEPASTDGSADFLSTYRQVMLEEYESLARASDLGRATLLDHYGATNHHEFFAVATECFFTQGKAMLESHPRLYDVLKRYYRQDPAARELQALINVRP
jgi:Mlc titration factor MtfA (ptsG expression regulator)